MRDIKKSEDGTAVSPHIVIDVPLIIGCCVISLMLIVRLLVSVLVERVEYAFDEDLFGVLRSIGPFGAWNRV